MSPMTEKTEKTQSNNPIEAIATAIGHFDAVTEMNTSSANKTERAEGEPLWLRFGLSKNEFGWRTLEFFAWVFDCLTTEGHHVVLFPVAPAPHEHGPGECLSFVVEYMPQGDEQDSTSLAEFLVAKATEHWIDVSPDTPEA